MRARWVGLTAVLAVGVLTACGSGMQEATPSPIGPPPGAPDRWKPAVDDTWQWQLAGPPNTAYDVAVYDIDLFDTPTATIDALQEQGRRIVCYFSAGSSEEWRPDFGRFMASDMGQPLDDWPGERWLDTRSFNVREIMRGRLELARSKGCDGVEPDNVEAYGHDSGVRSKPAELHTRAHPCPIEVDPSHLPLTDRGRTID